MEVSIALSVMQIEELKRCSSAEVILSVAFFKT
jgi:hypothetical protein